MVAAIIDREPLALEHAQRIAEDRRALSPRDQGVQPNRSSPRVEKVIDAGCCPV